MAHSEPVSTRKEPQGLAPAQSSGAWYFLFQVFTGILLLVFVGLHLLANHQQGGALLTFDQVVARLRSPAGLVVELGLLVTVAYHTMNGLRGVFLDLGGGPSRERLINRAAFVVGAAIVVYGFWLTFSI